MALKVAELRKLAEEKEIPGWEDMDKKELEAALKAAEEFDSGKVNSDDGVKEEGKKVDEEGHDDVVPSKPASTSSVLAPGVKEDHVPVGSKAEIMKRKLATQPKIRILIPLEGGEKMGSTESVILNGYRMNILKGVYVSVPEQIADVIATSRQQSEAALYDSTRLDDIPSELQ